MLESRATLKTSFFLSLVQDFSEFVLAASAGGDDVRLSPCRLGLPLHRRASGFSSDSWRRCYSSTGAAATLCIFARRGPEAPRHLG